MKGSHIRQDSMEPSDLWDDVSNCRCGDRLKTLEQRARKQHQRCLAHSLVGTPNYIAPEVLLRKGVSLGHFPRELHKSAAHLEAILTSNLWSQMTSEESLQLQLSKTLDNSHCVFVLMEACEITPLANKLPAYLISFLNCPCFQGERRDAPLSQSPLAPSCGWELIDWV